MSAWPFTTAELTAGLRRYFAEPTLHVRELHERPLAPQAAGTLSAVSKHVRGLRVGYTVSAKSFSVECVVKDAQEATLAGLTGVGLREAGVYRSLASQLPMETPALVAADPAGDWLVLEAVEAGIAPANWSAGDYRRAGRALAELHERFWDLADDLAAYPWLARSLTGEFEIHVYAAAQATAKIIRDDQPRLITGSADALAALGQIVSQADKVVEPLRAAPQTLLHGDFWPGNVALHADGEMVVYDWQLAGIGPGPLDLLAFVATSQWECGILPVAADELVAAYREEIAQRVGFRWPEAEWQLVWDHALLWRFTQEMIGWVARVPPQTFQARAHSFAEVWLEPVLAAADRRLAPMVAF